jgi:hypothetical protein
MRQLSVFAVVDPSSRGAPPRLLHLASHRRALFGAVVGRPQRMLPL